MRIINVLSSLKNNFLINFAKLSWIKSNRKKERNFVIFMDFSNIRHALVGEKSIRKQVENFSWLIDPIRKKGNIILGFVFVPDNLYALAPIIQLSKRHGFKIIVCPRQMVGTIAKNKDTVDALMEDTAKAIIEIGDKITDVVIVSGDRDFKELARFAWWRGKRVTVTSIATALSDDFMELKKDGVVDVYSVEENSFQGE